MEELAEEFAITFVFPISERDAIDGYIAEVGKDELTNKIIEICQNAEAKF
jgi:hypothetical protein